eukprot:g14914.t1
MAAKRTPRKKTVAKKATREKAATRKATAKRRTGRKKEAVPAKLADAVIAWIESGQTLTSFCAQAGMPAPRTVYDWMDKDEAFAARFARAREIGFDALAEQALEIAYTPEEGVRSEEGENDKGAFSKQVREDMLGHRRLKVDTILKLLARWDPKRYSERVSVDTKSEAKVEHSGKIEGGGPPLPDPDAFAAHLVKGPRHDRLQQHDAPRVLPGALPELRAVHCLEALDRPRLVLAPRAHSCDGRLGGDAGGGGSMRDPRKTKIPDWVGKEPGVCVFHPDDESRIADTLGELRRVPRLRTHGCEHLTRGTIAFVKEEPPYFASAPRLEPWRDQRRAGALSGSAMTKTANAQRLEQQRAAYEKMVPGILGNRFLPHFPHDKQALLLSAHQHCPPGEVFRCLYGGAAGGGKSDALLMAAAQFVHLPHYKALILRRTYTEMALPDAIMSRAIEWWSGKASWNGTSHVMTFPSGARIQFGYHAKPADNHIYQGGAYHFVGFDELTHWPDERAWRRPTPAGPATPG